MDHRRSKLATVLRQPSQLVAAGTVVCRGSCTRRQSSPSSKAGSSAALNHLKTALTPYPTRPSKPGGREELWTSCPFGFSPEPASAGGDDCDFCPGRRAALGL